MASASRHTLLREGKSTLWLAFPLIAGQLSQMLVGLSDTLMIGRLGVTQLAASTFANTILYVPLMAGIGMAMAVSIRVSQARGAEDPSMAREALRNGLLISFCIGLLAVVGAACTIPFFGLFRQEPEVTEAATTYFLIVAASMIPATSCMAIKNHADAMNHPWPPFWISLGGVLTNIGLNWILIYGNVGAPRLGLEGAGIATLLARSATFVALILWCRQTQTIREWVPRKWFRPPHLPSVFSLLKVGLPTTLQLLAEISAFVMATIIIGTISKTALASHQIAITCVATIFMVPLGLSMAMTVRVGEAWGAKRLERLRPILTSGWIMGITFALISATTIGLFPEAIAGWVIKDPTTQKLAASLLLISVFFLMADAIQILSVGALRGLNDTTLPAWLAVIAYWIVSIPIGSWFALGLGWGAAGIWWGITIGITLTAIILCVRVWRKTA